MSIPTEENEKTAKKPSKAKAEYTFSEETTSVTIPGITESQGKKLEKCLKGQIHASNDLQLEFAIGAHLRRMGVSHGKPIIDRG